MNAVKMKTLFLSLALFIGFQSMALGNVHTETWDKIEFDRQKALNILDALNAQIAKYEGIKHPTMAEIKASSLNLYDIWVLYDLEVNIEKEGEEDSSPPEHETRLSSMFYIMDGDDIIEYNYFFYDEGEEEYTHYSCGCCHIECERSNDEMECVGRSYACCQRVCKKVERFETETITKHENQLREQGNLIIVPRGQLLAFIDYLNTIIAGR